MSLLDTAPRILRQLEGVVRQIMPADFSRPSETLGGATIGQHIRHTVEFFLCFQKGCQQGVVNYDERAHDVLIETRREVALASLRSLIVFVSNLQENSELELQSCYDPDGSYETLGTSAMRELVYNVEHAVHHMAMIKIGLKEVAPYVQVGEDFGIAASTIRHARHAATLVRQ